MGITRAQEYLCLTHAESRRLHGSEYLTSLSRFVKELPESTIEHVRIGGSFIDFSNEGKQSPEGNYQLGQLVEHDIFGSGIVLALEGREESLRIQVNFEDSGIKWLVASYRLYHLFQKQSLCVLPFLTAVLQPVRLVQIL